MADELQLALLGPLEVRRAGTPVTGFTSSKVQALLCFLAVTGQVHLRPSLAGLLWGEMPEANAQNALRKALSNLRRLVGPHLAITRQAVTFNRDSAYWLDVEAFESLARGAAPAEGLTQPSIERLAEAVALYRGDFLAGFYQPLSGLYISPDIDPSIKKIEALTPVALLLGLDDYQELNFLDLFLKIH